MVAANARVSTTLDRSWAFNWKPNIALAAISAARAISMDPIAARFKTDGKDFDIAKAFRPVLAKMVEASATWVVVNLVVSANSNICSVSPDSWSLLTPTIADVAASDLVNSEPILIMALIAFTRA